MILVVSVWCCVVVLYHVWVIYIYDIMISLVKCNERVFQNQWNHIHMCMYMCIYVYLIISNIAHNLDIVKWHKLMLFKVCFKGSILWKKFVYVLLADFSEKNVISSFVLLIFVRSGLFLGDFLRFFFLSVTFFFQRGPWNLFFH